MESPDNSQRYEKIELKICPQVSLESCKPISQELNELKDLIKTCRLETQFQKLRYEQEIFELNQKIFNFSQDEVKKNLDESIFLKLQKKKEKILKLRSELEKNSEEFRIFTQELQLKSQISMEELAKKYETDLNFLWNTNKTLKQELSNIKKSFKSESFSLASELFSKEKGKLLDKISRLASQRNEANAKLEVLREDLRSFHSFLQIFNKEETLSRVDQIIQMVENNEKSDKDMILSSLFFIREDFTKMQLSEKVHQRVLSQKNFEIQEMKTFLPKSLRISPAGSKVQTTNSSPTSCQSSSFFRNFSPKHVPSYSFQEDTKKGMLGEDAIISEFAGLKLKYALLQEFLITRDNDFRLIFHEIKKKPENLQEMIDLVYQKLEESQKFLD